MRCPRCGGQGLACHPRDTYSAVSTGRRLSGLARAGHPVLALVLFGIKAVQMLAGPRHRCLSCGKRF